jgi:transglutaminase-like putative cysteine protease
MFTIKNSLVFLILLFPIRSVYADDWLPITEAELALTECEIDPEFGAEYLFKQLDIRHYHVSGNPRERIDHYYRIKVYDNRGVEQFLEDSIKHGKKQRIVDLKARTIKPDGTILPVARDEIFSNKVIKSSNRDVREKAFAFKNLEPGDIIEVQYGLTGRVEKFVAWIRYQDSIPIRKLDATIKPFPSFGHYMISTSVDDESWTSRTKRRYQISLSDLEAAQSEPFGPPAMHTEINTLLYYHLDSKIPKDFWKDFSKDLSKSYRSEIKPSRKVKEKANEIVANRDSEEAQLRALYKFCQDEITNLDYSYGIYTESEKENLKENNSAQDTLEAGYGTPHDIMCLFAAMATGIGFDARVAATADTSWVFFSADTTTHFSLPDRSVFVPVGETLYYCNPGNPFLEFGHLPWWSCQSFATVADKKGQSLVQVPMPSANYSRASRKADLQLDEYGGLTGHIDILYDGFKALDMREERSELLTQDDVEEWVESYFEDIPQDVAITNIEITELSEPDLPFKISFDVAIENYAEYAGSRLFIQPALFQKDAKPLFEEENRIDTIVFPYPWSEADMIQWTLPEGYSVEKASAPVPFDMGVFGKYDVVVGKAKNQPIVIYKRDFQFDIYRLPVEYYGTLKQLFEVIREQDQHTIILKKDS